MSRKRKNGFIIFATMIGIISIAIWILVADLPGEKEINSFKPESTVYNLSHFDWKHGTLVPVRKYISLNQISPELRSAVIISEDDAFFAHSGINLTELKKAFQENLHKRRYARGASTITMQVARNAFLTKKKTLIRKLKEIILARRIEKLWTKKKIFEYYLNIVEWGPNIYGVEAAAWYYFNKPASQLNLAEASLLAAILPNPKVLSLFENMSAAKKRQLRVLRLMRGARLITDEEFEDLVNQPVYLRGTKPIITEPEILPPVSIFDQALKDPRIPERLKRDADSSGIIFLPEE